MIVAVHTHLPTHLGTVPEDEMVVETTWRSGETVQHTHSVDDYVRDMAPVDKSFVFGIAPRPWRPDEQVLADSRWPAELNHNDVAAETARRDPNIGRRNRLFGKVHARPFDFQVGPSIGAVETHRDQAAT